MIQIGRQWHVNHIVDDYRVVAQWYRDVFGAVDVFTDEWLDAEKRWASMVTIGDLAVDVMEPTAEAAQLPLGKFLSRFGSHFHAAAYFADSGPTEIFDALAAHGVRCFGLGGAGRESMVGKPMSPVFTHPRDTAGQLEFMPFTEVKPGPLGVPGAWEDPRFVEGWSNAPWRDHPLTIEGWRVGVVVNDIDRASGVYLALGAAVLGDEKSGAAIRRRLKLGTNTTVELIVPASEDTVAGRDLSANGEIMHSCVFECRDLSSVESHLSTNGVKLAEREGGRLIADPETCYGAVFEFVEYDASTGSKP